MTYVLLHGDGYVVHNRPFTTLTAAENARSDHADKASLAIIPTSWVPWAIERAHMLQSAEWAAHYTRATLRSMAAMPTQGV